MPIVLKTVSYNQLNARQQEAHNYQKVSGLLAGYGYSTMRLQDDWLGADFIAQHHSGLDLVKVQLKSRFTLDKKYYGKDIYIVFPSGKKRPSGTLGRPVTKWYIFDHDVTIDSLTKAKARFITTKSWAIGGAYSWPTLPAKYKPYLQQL